MMDSISNADRLVILLRQKLRERSRLTSGNVRAAKAGQGPDAAAVTPTGLKALAAVEGADERPLRRALIQHLLADQLGPALVNDAQFQQIVSRVTEAIEGDIAASELLSRLLAEVRPPDAPR